MMSKKDFSECSYHVPSSEMFHSTKTENNYFICYIRFFGGNLLV